MDLKKISITRPVGISLQSPTGKPLDRPRYTGPVLFYPIHFPQKITRWQAQ